MMLRPKLRDAHENPAAAVPSALGDLRFRQLLAQEDWAALPAPVRRRFSKRVALGNCVVYAGEVVETRLTPAGWALAQFARLFGGPLPTSTDCGVPAVVTVTEDAATGGQIWTRLYARKKGFPQIIHSCKRFGGATGLEECVGGGVGMALTVHQLNGALLFRSADYFLRIGPFRVSLPGWLTPGALTVTHAEGTDGRFTFLLEIVHPLFGAIVHQLARFREVTP